MIPANECGPLPGARAQAKEFQHMATFMAIHTEHKPLYHTPTMGQAACTEQSLPVNPNTHSQIPSVPAHDPWLRNTHTHTHTQQDGGMRGTILDLTQNKTKVGLQGFFLGTLCCGRILL